MNTLIQLLEELIGRRAKAKKYPASLADMRTSKADVTRTYRLLAWEPQVTLREWVQSLVDWYQAERSWAREIVTN